MAKPRRLTAKKDALTPDEVSHLEALVKHFEDSERTWQRMMTPLDEADPWTQVEDHLLERREDADRRWKFFAK